MKREFDYTICKDNNTVKFKETCEAIRKNIPDLIEKRLAIDIDGSTIQWFIKDDKNIIVYDDYEIGAVFVESDMELDFIEVA